MLSFIRLSLGQLFADILLYSLRRSRALKRLVRLSHKEAEYFLVAAAVLLCGFRIVGDYLIDRFRKKIVVLFDPEVAAVGYLLGSAAVFISRSIVLALACDTLSVCIYSTSCANSLPPNRRLSMSASPRFMRRISSPIT